MRPTRNFTAKRSAFERPRVARILCAAKWLVPVGLFLLLSISFFGCGIKGPPVPPRKAPVPAVAELAYEVVDQTVKLTWRLPEPLSAKQAKHAVFGLYRSRTAMAESGCDGCPLVFQKVATVPYVHTETNRFSINAPLASGYRYVFKVRLEMDRGGGPDSNLVQFDHLPDRPSGGSDTP